jgi:ComF family protein
MTISKIQVLTFVGGHTFVHVNRTLKYAAHDWARPLFKILLDTVFPPRCLVCNRLFKPTVTQPGADQPANAKIEIIDTSPESYQLLASYCCPECMSTFTVISAPLCSGCGIMFKSRQGRNHFCGDCITQPKKFRIARAAVTNNQQLMTAIHRFKYAGKIQLAGLLGGLMLNAYRRFWEQEKFDLVLPVPLHINKFRKRGFNQSYLLIRSWKSISNPTAVELSTIPVSTDILIKNKATLPQTGLGRQQRLKNIQGAFSIRDPHKVNAKKVLLIDDVYTTGATVNECARMLLNAGAELVDVLTVARAR